MKLEVLSRLPEATGPNGAGSGTPLLFVHGAFAGAWCWAEHFLPWFAARGYPAHAVSLRGHGASDGKENLRCHTIRDYVADMLRAARRLVSKPVIIGHSMGGMIAQKSLESCEAKGMVLMASVPPEGLMWPTWELAWRDPMLWQELNLVQTLSPRFATLRGLRRALFSDDVDDDKLALYFSYTQTESHRAIVDMMGLDLPRAKANGAPVLVLGAARDVFFPPRYVTSTAKAYEAEHEIFPDMAHAMMLETGWEAVAERILRWLRANNL